MLQRGLRTSFAVAVPLEEREPMAQDAFAAVAVLAEFALLKCCNFCVSYFFTARNFSVPPRLLGIYSEGV